VILLRICGHVDDLPAALGGLAEAGPTGFLQLKLDTSKNLAVSARM
jgi:hypothetical protein